MWFVSPSSVRTQRFVLVGLAGLLFVGCSRSSLIGRQYDDFTAYYNEFHNAEEAFEEGLQSIRQEDRTVDRNRYLSIFLTPAAAASEVFDEVVQKSADVVRKHPNSKWVDDALLLIGKSYFYQKNYAGAAEKCREVIDLDTERTPEAQFWLARALLAADEVESAEEALRGGIETGSDDGPWTSRMRLLRGELYVRQQLLADAVTFLTQGLEGAVPDRVAARSAFLLGQVHETVGHVEEARTAYGRAQDRSQRYELEMAAELSALELQGLHGDSELALERLRGLQTDDENETMRGEIALILARIHRANGRLKTAERALKAGLYGEKGSLPPRSSQATTGRLHYELATVYRNGNDFRKAAAHFDTAGTALKQREQPTSGVDFEQHLPDAPTDAATQAARHRELAARAAEVARFDSLLALGRLSETELQSVVNEMQARRSEQGTRSDTAAWAARRVGRTNSEGARVRQEPVPAAAQTSDSESGFLFYKDARRVREARHEFQRTWGDRPRVENWRRRAALRTGLASTEMDDDGGHGSNASVSDSQSGTERRNAVGSEIPLSAVPRDSSSRAEVEAKRAVARYELANALFLTAGRPDSAAALYRRILNENEGHPVTERARYALAEAYRALGDSVMARDTYRDIVEASPGTALAARSRTRLGRSSLDHAGARSDEAEGAYARAYNDWESGRPVSAFGQMLDVARHFPDTEAAPRALLASGILYWRHAQPGMRTVVRRRMRQELTDFLDPDSKEVQSKGDPVDSPSPRGGSIEGTNGHLHSQGPDSLSYSAIQIDIPDAADDSVGVVPDTNVLGTHRVPDHDDYASLKALLTRILKRYPDRPQAARARTFLSLIEEREDS